MFTLLLATALTTAAPTFSTSNPAAASPLVDPMIHGGRRSTDNLTDDPMISGGRRSTDNLTDDPMIRGGRRSTGSGLGNSLVRTAF